MPAAFVFKNPTFGGGADPIARIGPDSRLAVSGIASASNTDGVPRAPALPKPLPHPVDERNRVESHSRHLMRNRSPLNRR
jgi:hypothetical protein